MYPRRYISVVNMESVHLRLDEETIERIDKERIKLDMSRADFYRKIIKEYLDTVDHIKDTNWHNLDTGLDTLKHETEILRQQLEQKDAVIQALQGRIQSTENQLGWMQHEYSRLNDKLLLPAPEKKWYHFWK
jgi:predicted nuclease with TOPRIM domain